MGIRILRGLTMAKAQTDDTLTPLVLYKYLPPDRIDLLLDMEIRFSRPSDFNDAFDSHYVVTASDSKTVSDGKTARSRLKNRLGIFCLTESRDNHLMWVHYAKNHT